jgi:tRNA-dihydrouridine synthase
VRTLASTGKTGHLFAMRIGPYELQSNLFLSPLAGYTNLPFRLVVREIGGLDWTTTDLVNARSLIEKNPRALQMIRTAPAERRLAVQLFGAVQRRCATPP